MISDEEVLKIAKQSATDSVDKGMDSKTGYVYGYLHGYRKCEAINNQNEIRLLRKIENLIIENEKLRDRLFGDKK